MGGELSFLKVGWIVMGHGIGNITGGIGNYLNIFDNGKRKWNFVEKFYQRYLGEKVGSFVFYGVDLGFNLYGAFRQVPVHTKGVIYDLVELERYCKMPKLWYQIKRKHIFGAVVDIIGIYSNIDNLVKLYRKRGPNAIVE